jgi:membrane associated rhomboid family serine protease
MENAVRGRAAVRGLDDGWSRSAGRTVVLAVACYLGLLWLRLALPDWHAMVQMMIDNLAFNPSLIARKEFWQLFTYPFIEVDWVQLAAALLSIWMFGSMLEQQRGWRWMGEFYLAATVGGAALADLVGPLLGRWIPYVSGVRPARRGW